MSACVSIKRKNGHGQRVKFHLNFIAEGEYSEEAHGILHYGYASPTNVSALLKYNIRL